MHVGVGGSAMRVGMFFFFGLSPVYLWEPACIFIKHLFTADSALYVIFQLSSHSSRRSRVDVGMYRSVREGKKCEAV